MKTFREKFVFLIVLLLIFLTAPILAGNQQFADLGDFQLENGQVIKECRLGYRTFGKLNSSRSNAVLFPTWFGGTSEEIGNLIGGDKLIDSTKYFIIAVDAFGNGISSSPSESKLQPGKQFPIFTISDMVRAQHVLLNEHLKINHLFAVIGGSMGGMQTFEWMVRYPDFTDKAVPYVGTPKFGSYDILLWRQALNIIEIGERYGVPGDSIRGMLNSLINMQIRTPEWVAEHYKPEQMPGIFEKFFSGEPEIFTNANYAAQIRAMLQHDVSRRFGGDLKKAAARVKAKILIIVSKTDHIVNPSYALKFAEFLGAETMVLDDPCGHLAIGCELQKVSKVISEFLAE